MKLKVSVTMRHEDRRVDAKERAKRVIAEIVRQAGGMLQNRSDLFDAFYHAHLIYAEGQPGYLSTWPMVKVPGGPGIDRARAGPEVSARLPRV